MVMVVIIVPFIVLVLLIALVGSQVVLLFYMYTASPANIDQATGVITYPEDDFLFYMQWYYWLGKSKTPFPRFVRTLSSVTLLWYVRCRNILERHVHSCLQEHGHRWSGLALVFLSLRHTSLSSSALTGQPPPLPHWIRRTRLLPHLPLAVDPPHRGVC